MFRVPGTATSKLQQLNTVDVKILRQNQDVPQASGTRGSQVHWPISTVASLSEARGVTDWVTVATPRPQQCPMTPRRAKAHPLSGSLISQYGSQSKALERGFFWILILLRRMISKQSPAPIAAAAGAFMSRFWARAHPFSNPPSLRTILPKLVPGQLLSIAARRRYDRKQRRVLDSHSQPAQQPGP